MNKFLKFFLVFLVFSSYVFVVSADWVRVANYTTGAITNNIYICNGTGMCGFNWSDILSKPNTLAGYNITDAYTKAEIDAQQLSQNTSFVLVTSFDDSQLSQNNTFLSLGNWSKDSQYYYNKTEIDAQQLSQNNTIASLVNLSLGNFSAYGNATYLLISNYQSHDQDLNTSSNVSFDNVYGDGGVFSGVLNTTTGADALLGYGNVRLGTDDADFAGRISFEYDHLGLNTLWQIDNGGDTLRFFNNLAVYARINASGISTDQNVWASGVMYEGGQSLNAKYNDTLLIQSVNNSLNSVGNWSADKALIQANISGLNGSFVTQTYGNDTYYLKSNPNNFVNGTGTANRLALWVSNVSLTNSSIFANRSRVGIFDDTPDAMLDVNVEDVNVEGLIVQGIAGQNASLFDVRSNVPDIYIEVKANGSFYYNGYEVCSAGNNQCVTNLTAIIFNISSVNSSLNNYLLIADYNSAQLIINNTISSLGNWSKDSQYYYNITQINSFLNSLGVNISGINGSLNYQVLRIDSVNSTVIALTSRLDILNATIISVNNTALSLGNYSANAFSIANNISNVNESVNYQKARIDLLNATQITHSDQILGIQNNMTNVNATANLKLVDVTSANSYITTSGATNKTITFQESVLNSTIATALATTYYNVTNVTMITGTNAGSLADINSYDDVSYNISEVNSDMNVTINVSVTATNPNELIIRYKTTAGEVDVVNVNIWDYDESEWEGYVNLATTNGIYIIKEIGILDGTAHVQNNITRIQFITSNLGARTDKWQFDWVTIAKGVSSASGQEIDPLSIHRDGTIPLSANWDAGSYNITASWILANINASYVQNPYWLVEANYTYLYNTLLSLGNYSANAQSIALNISNVNYTANLKTTLSEVSSYGNSTYGRLGVGNVWLGENQYNGSVLFYNPVYFYNNVTLSSTNAMRVNSSIVLTDIAGNIVFNVSDQSGVGVMILNGNNIQTDISNRMLNSTVNQLVGERVLNSTLDNYLLRSDENYTSAISFSNGGDTKTLNLARNGMSNLTASFSLAYLKNASEGNFTKLYALNNLSFYGINNGIQFFNSSGSSKGLLYIASESASYLSLSTGLVATGVIRSDSDIFTTGSGDNIWTGTSTEANSLAWVGASGQVMFKNLSIGRGGSGNIATQVGVLDVDGDVNINGTIYLMDINLTNEINSIISNVSNVNASLNYVNSSLQSEINARASLGNWSSDKQIVLNDISSRMLNTTVNQLVGERVLNSTLSSYTTLTEYNAGQLSQNNTFLSLGNWSKDSQYYYNKTEVNSIITNVGANLTSLGNWSSDRASVVLNISNVNATANTKLTNSSGASLLNLTVSDRVIISKSPPFYVWYYNATVWDCFNGTGTIYNRGNSSISC